MEGILTRMFAHQNAPRVDIENYLTAASSLKAVSAHNVLDYFYFSLASLYDVFV